MKVLLILSMVMIGCGEVAQEEEGDTQAAIVEDEDGNEVGELTAKLVAVLPQYCTADQVGALIYVNETEAKNFYGQDTGAKGFWYCDEEPGTTLYTWFPIDLKGEDGKDGKDGAAGKDGKDGEDGTPGMVFERGWACDLSEDPLDLITSLVMKAYVFEFTDGSHYISCISEAWSSILDIQGSEALFYPAGYEGQIICRALNAYAQWDPNEPSKIVYRDKTLILSSEEECSEFPEED